MSENELPVYVSVRRDGGLEQVRVGTAVRQGDGFVVRLGELTISEAPKAQPQAARAGKAPDKPVGALPSVFPPYGRSKGQPIAGASRADLDFYANGSKRTLSDPEKARYHEKERAMLAAIEAELARQGARDEDDVRDSPDTDFNLGGK